MYMPPIESDIPMDVRAEVTLPQMDEREELEVRARTIQLISEKMVNIILKLQYYSSNLFHYLNKPSRIN